MESVGFDPATNQLEIEFRDGGVYRYSVPRRIHQELMSADSLGAYFARRIRHHYPGWKVQGSAPIQQDNRHSPCSTPPAQQPSTYRGRHVP